MKPENFKSFKKEFMEKMKEILTQNIYSELEIYESSDKIQKGQFFLLNLTLLLDEKKGILLEVPLFYFQVKKKINEFLDYNYFYNLDDELFEELFNCCESGYFDSLSGLFKEAEKHDGSLFLDIASWIVSDNFLLRSRMEEPVCIIDYKEGKVVVSSLMNERYQYKTVDEGGQEISIIVPFDKREMFPAHTEGRKTKEKRVESLKEAQ